MKNRRKSVKKYLLNMHNEQL